MQESVAVAWPARLQACATPLRYRQVGPVLPSLWHGAHWRRAQLTPHGLVVVFMLLWQTKQMGVPLFVLLTLCASEVTTLKHNELCWDSGSTRGSVHDGVAIVPAWHLRHAPLLKA